MCPVATLIQKDAIVPRAIRTSAARIDQHDLATRKNVQDWPAHLRKHLHTMSEKAMVIQKKPRVMFRPCWDIERFSQY
jgi:hypothetical protein